MSYCSLPAFAYELQVEQDLYLMTANIWLSCCVAAIVLLQDVAGVIDFGDAAHTWVVNDVAIAMAYAMLSPLAK